MENENENENEPSFAELLEESYVAPTNYEPGQKTIAPIVSIGAEWTFLNLGGKSEGYFPTAEIKNEEGTLQAQEGDKITAYFLASEKDGMKFTTKLGAGAAAQSHLQDAHRAGIPLEGTVEKEVKGGYDVKIAGSVRAFCPFSQAALQRIDPETFVGNCLPFRIIEYKEGGKNIVVSRRIILEEELRQKIEALKETLKVGAIVSGAVTSIKDFGAFVRIDEGLEGLLPISEICWGRVEDITERLKVGQRIEVQVTKLDWEEERFSFSLKNAQPDPWENVAEKFPEGSIQKGTVARLLNFGAFITLAPGIDGLLHIGVLGAGRRLTHAKEALKEGQVLDVKIDKINREEKRIGLSPTEDLCAHLGSKKKSAPEKEDTRKRDYEQYVKEGQAKTENSGGSLGTLGDLLKAQLDK